METRWKELAGQEPAREQNTTKGRTFDIQGAQASADKAKDGVLIVKQAEQ